MKVGRLGYSLQCPGLSQALSLMGDIDELICLGDSIYEYRFSNEVVALLRLRGAQVIVGNHEDIFRPAGVRARARTASIRNSRPGSRHSRTGAR